MPDVNLFTRINFCSQKSLFKWVVSHAAFTALTSQMLPFLRNVPWFCSWCNVSVLQAPETLDLCPACRVTDAFSFLTPWERHRNLGCLLLSALPRVSVLAGARWTSTEWDLWLSLTTSVFAGKSLIKMWLFSRVMPFKKENSVENSQILWVEKIGAEVTGSGVDILGSGLSWKTSPRLSTSDDAILGLWSLKPQPATASFSVVTNCPDIPHRFLCPSSCERVKVELRLPEQRNDCNQIN